ncbi:MAG: hypothetical protein ACXVGH_10895, partial [Mycobacteriales bacterium]
MPRSSPLRKFGPLVAVVAVQLLLVLVVPSTARNATQDAALSGPTGLGTGAVAAGGEAAAGTAGGAVASGSVPGATGGTAAGTVPTGAGTAGGSGGTTSAAVGPGVVGPSAAGAVAGDTRHCVGGRQFDP